MADDPQRPAGARGRSERPQYKLYRSRPRWFKAPGRVGEPGFDDLHALREGTGGPGSRRRPWTPGRVIRWILVVIAVWIGLSLLLFLISAQIERSQVSDEASTALDGGGFPLTSDTTTLVLGSDQRRRNAPDCPPAGCGPPRSDSIVLMRTGPGHAARLSIPRDTIVDIPGHGPDKINAAYAIGGPALTITTVKRYLGIKVNHLVEVNFDNFPAFVDALGGIDFTDGCVSSDINGGTRNGGVTLRLRPGTNHLDGKQALALARTRKNACRPGEDDLTRAKRQQQLLTAMKSRLSSPTTFLRLPLVAWDGPKAIRTDMSGLSLLGLFGALETAGSPPTHVLQPSGAETLPNGGSGLRVSDEERRTEVRRFLNG
jgi:LCP family protein required for cell wall assembly